MKTIKVKSRQHVVVRHIATLEELAVLHTENPPLRGDVIRLRSENDESPFGKTYAVTQREIDPEDGSVVLFVTSTVSIRINKDADLVGTTASLRDALKEALEKRERHGAVEPLSAFDHLGRTLLKVGSAFGTHSGRITGREAQESNLPKDGFHLGGYTSDFKVEEGSLPGRPLTTFLHEDMRVLALVARAVPAYSPQTRAQAKAILHEALGENWASRIADFNRIRALGEATTGTPPADPAAPKTKKPATKGRGPSPVDKPAKKAVRKTRSDKGTSVGIPVDPDSGDLG